MAEKVEHMNADQGELIVPGIPVTDGATGRIIGHVIAGYQRPDGSVVADLSIKKEEAERLEPPRRFADISNLTNRSYRYEVQGRRVRALRVPYRTVLHALVFSKASLPDVVEVFRVPGLPEDVEVLSVHEDYMHRTFTFILTHPSFDPVPDGQMAPLHPPGNCAPYFDCEVVRIRPAE